MAVDPWLPVGYRLPNEERPRQVLHEGLTWQIYELQGGGALLVTRPELWSRWREAGLIADGVFQTFEFDGEMLHAYASGRGHVLAPVCDTNAPNNRTEALSFANALRATRRIDPASPLHDAIYLERLSLLLPTYSLTPGTADDVVFGGWLTGGFPVPVYSFRRLKSFMTWLPAAQLQDLIRQAGFHGPFDGHSSVAADGSPAVTDKPTQFVLPGRPQLEAFFNEHIIDLVEHPERYKALGIDFPSAIILHGPPGCGKTFAVEKLVEYLGWPNFAIDASSVASPYIHDTSRKVSDVFEKAMKCSPSVVVIDEMEAFLADRQVGSSIGHHRVEEVAEFLRRIPEAIKNHVLIIAMTNHIGMIDPAILRRGRFDHVIKVDMASEVEVRALLVKLVGDLPKEDDVDVGSLAIKLQGRPLSDVAFVVREGARLAARAGGDKLTQANLVQALNAAANRGGSEESRKIGFV